MPGPHPDHNDLVSFGPTNTDTRAFAIGLWATEVVLFAGVVAGLTVLRGVDPLINVGVACGALAWFLAFYAVVLRGRLRPLPGVGLRVVAVVGVLVFAAAMVAALSGAWPVSVGTAVALFGLGQAALVAAYAGRMFRWGRAAA
ncbi:hypothetical protein EDF46_0411 [Frondihabitans sp. PhB188]|uniref:hypothetical protein n=1 Tax=Frondihabitans sp. PhB188 TaxID=2485200 RepID=UPI000F475765|nr:hypothetical protein [Frondihabitans sp. PhB188]ROQ41044.1 hypothetical protein EDF46_0411 [Frondihabitans sp. PhB188]